MAKNAKTSDYKDKGKKIMPRVYPQDSPGRRAETRSFQILLPKFDASHLDFLGQDHHDHGVDYTFEYIENNEYHGHRILSQVKGSAHLRMGSKSYISYPLPVKTANYAVECHDSFVLFVVDLKSEIAYYLPLQDYFSANQDKYERLAKNIASINVHIPIENVVNYEDSDLIAVAKSGYYFNRENDTIIKL